MYFKYTLTLRQILILMGKINRIFFREDFYIKLFKEIWLYILYLRLTVYKLNMIIKLPEISRRQNPITTFPISGGYLPD